MGVYSVQPIHWIVLRGNYRSKLQVPEDAGILQCSSLCNCSSLVTEVAFHNSVLRSAWSPMVVSMPWNFKPVYQVCLVNCAELTIIRLTLFSKSVIFKCHCFNYTSSCHIDYGSVTFCAVIQSQWPKQLWLYYCFPSWVASIDLRCPASLWLFQE